MPAPVFHGSPDSLVSLRKSGFADNGEQLKIFTFHLRRSFYYTQGERFTGSVPAGKLIGASAPNPEPPPENRRKKL